MRPFPRITFYEWLFLLAVCGLLFWAFGYDEVQRYRGARAGRAAAEVDVAAGVLTLKLGGRPPYYRKQVIALYKEQYEVDVVYTGDCCSMGYERGYHVAYNQYIREVLQERHVGFNFSRTYEEIVELARTRHEAEKLSAYGELTTIVAGRWRIAQNRARSGGGTGWATWDRW